MPAEAKRKRKKKEKRRGKSSPRQPTRPRRPEKGKKMRKDDEKMTNDRDNTLGPKRHRGARRALTWQKARESARKGGGSRTPTVWNGKGVVRDEFGSRK